MRQDRVLEVLNANGDEAADFARQPADDKRPLILMEAGFW